jgi:hypothetical protein
MPRFFFDVFFDCYVVLDPEGMAFEQPAGAAAAADEMVRHLSITRVELCAGESWLRVRDERRREVYRSPIVSEQAGGDVPPRLGSGAHSPAGSHRRHPRGSCSQHD